MKNNSTSRKWASKGLFMLGLMTLAYANATYSAPYTSDNSLGIRYWQWAMSIPAGDHPFNDATGAKCGIGQSGPVWFLVGTPGGGTAVRDECDFIPNGKELFFPLVNLAYFGYLNDPPESRTLEAIRSFLMLCDMDSIREVEIVVDGKTLRGGTGKSKGGTVKYSLVRDTANRAQPFQIQLPTDNYYQMGPDALPGLLLSPSVQEGLYVHLMPLRPGPHTIHWTATWDCDGQPTTQDITYNLRVLPNVAGLETGP